MKKNQKAKPSAPKAPAPEGKITKPKKRTRTDSTAGALAAAQNAQAGLLQPPLHMKLRPDDMPYWSAIIRARAREMWTDIDLIMAANLARAMNDIAVQSAALDKEGASVKNGKGTPVANPRFNAITQLTDRVTRMMRLLHVHPAATAGRSELEGKIGREEREALATAEGEGLSPEDADLLASFGPVH